MRYFIELIAFVGLLAAAIYFGGTVTLEIGQSQMCFSVAALAIGVACLVLLLELFLAICRGIGKLFQGRPKWQKGLDSLQSAFSNVLLKDKVSAGKALSQAKKHLGDIPLVSKNDYTNFARSLLDLWIHNLCLEPTPVPFLIVLYH